MRLEKTSFQFVFVSPEGCGFTHLNEVTDIRTPSLTKLFIISGTVRHFQLRRSRISIYIVYIVTGICKPTFTKLINNEGDHLGVRLMEVVVSFTFVVFGFHC